MKKILIIEDEMIVRSIYRRKFEISGYQVETAEEGAAALKVLSSFKPDAVQVDIQLPGMDGVEVIRQIRSWPEFKDLPVLVISSFYRPDLAKEAWKAGATKCVSKMDCTPNLALELVEQMLSGDLGDGSAGKVNLAGTPNEGIRLLPAHSPWEDSTEIRTRKSAQPGSGIPSGSTVQIPKPPTTLPTFASDGATAFTARTPAPAPPPTPTLPGTPQAPPIPILPAPPQVPTLPKPTTTPNFARGDSGNTISFTKPDPGNTRQFRKPDPEGSKMTTRPSFAVPAAQKIPIPETPAPAPAPVVPAEIPVPVLSAPSFPAPAPAAPAGQSNGSSADFRLEIRHEFLKRAPQFQSELRDRIGSLLKSKSPTEQLSLLNELAGSVASLASLSGITGFSRISHLADAMDALIKDLQKKPQQMTNSVLRTVAHASDCLNMLFRDLDRAPRDVPQSMLILAVDDEPIARRTISVALGKANLRCIALEDPKAALAMLRENTFDLIFLDAEMPELNGFQLCTEVRKLSTNKTTPVIFVTSLTKFEVRAQSSLAGGNDLIAKPFLMMELAVKALTYLLRPQTLADTKPAA